MDNLLEQAVAGYSAAKSVVTTLTGATQDLLHVHAGLLIFVGSALLLRKKMRSPVPILLVVFFAALNEGVDWLSGEPSYALEPFVDFGNTVFWPALLFLLARRWR